MTCLMHFLNYLTTYYLTTYYLTTDLHTTDHESFRFYYQMIKTSR